MEVGISSIHRYLPAEIEPIAPLCVLVTRDSGGCVSMFRRYNRLVGLVLASSVSLTASMQAANAADFEKSRMAQKIDARAVSVTLPAVDAIPSGTPAVTPALTGKVAESAAVSAATAPTVAGFLGAPSITPNTCIFVDNDDEKATELIQETYKWEEIPDSVGKTKITTGAQFPVKVVSELNSKTAKVGDAVEGMVKVDVKIGGKLVAAKGTRVVGHVFNVMPARRILVSELSRKRWFRANGEIGIEFDEMITKDNEHLPLVATPAKMARIVENKNEGRIMGVNAQGEVASPLSIQLKEQAIHLAIRAGAAGAGVFSMGAVPVAYAAIGALNPSFAFLHPVGKNVPHRRLKGAAMGFISGVPGGFLIADSIIKGVEASIKPGDEFLVEFKQDFTGEPATDAEMMANGSKDVHGEVVSKNKKKG